MYTREANIQKGSAHERKAISRFSRSVFLRPYISDKQARATVSEVLVVGAISLNTPRSKHMSASKDSRTSRCSKSKYS
jgi:hypothetical protein